MRKDYHDFKSKHSRRHTKQWLSITKLLKSESISEDKLAVIKAGKLTKDILKELGFQEENLEKNLQKAFLKEKPDLAKIEEAENIRQHIIKDPNHKLNHQKAVETVNVFAETLKKLNNVKLYKFYNFTNF